MVHSGNCILASFHFSFILADSKSRIKLNLPETPRSLTHYSIGLVLRFHTVGDTEVSDLFSLIEKSPVRFSLQGMKKTNYKRSCFVANGLQRSG